MVNLELINVRMTIWHDLGIKNASVQVALLLGCNMLFGELEEVVKRLRTALITRIEPCQHGADLGLHLTCKRMSVLVRGNDHILVISLLEHGELFLRRREACAPKLLAELIIPLLFRVQARVF